MENARSAPELAAQAAASAVMREAAASAVVNVLQGESAEEKATKVTSIPGTLIFILTLP